MILKIRALALCKADGTLTHAQRQMDSDLFFRTFFIYQLTNRGGQPESKQIKIATKGPPHYNTTRQN